jgi:hypothetical protein
LRATHCRIVGSSIIERSEKMSPSCREAQFLFRERLAPFLLVNLTSFMKANWWEISQIIGKFSFAAYFSASGGSNFS